jgi:F-type H+-transporting ATPase subunit epsilon
MILQEFAFSPCVENALESRSGKGKRGFTETLAIGSGFAEVTDTKVIVLTDSALGEAEIDEDTVEAAIQRAKEKLASVDHSLDAEEVAYLQGVIAKSTAALLFKRRGH